MPRKIRELEADLRRAGFVEKAGKGSHRNFAHPRFQGVITIAGKGGDDAKRYQEKQIAEALERIKRS